MDSLFFQEHSIKFSNFFATGQLVGSRFSRFSRFIESAGVEHWFLVIILIISPFSELGIAYRFFSWIPHSSRNILSNFQIFFATYSTGWHPVQSVHRVNWCKTLILVILGPKSYMAQAHKLQIDFGQCCGPILGLGLGSLQPTTNPYGFLVVKQAENWRSELAS